MHRLFFCLFLWILFAPLHADPWGKDADLVQKKVVCHEQPPPVCRTPILGAFSDIMINFHQNVISPADGPRSHYYPSSSQYTKDAMAKYGFFKGFILGCDRLMRENPENWVYPTVVRPDGTVMKYDPVK